MPDKDYCLIICVINEGTRFLSQIRQLSRLVSLVDIIVVDGHSTDGSTSTSILRKYRVHKVIQNSGSTDLSHQLQLGLEYAKAQKYKGIITMDGNGKDDVSSLPQFVRKLKEGYDFIQGSRFLPGGQYENTPLDRILGIKFFQVPIIRIVSHFPYTDPANGFKAFSSCLLTDSRLDLFRPVFTGYSLQYYLTVNAPRLGYKTIEIPVIRNYPPSGLIPTKINTISKKISVLKDIMDVVTNKYSVKDKYGLIDKWLRVYRFRECLKQLSLKKNTTLVDVGCGPDRMFTYYSDNKISKYIGLDPHLDPSFDAEKLNKYLPVNTADIVIGLALIEHLNSPQKFLKAAAAVSRNKAQLLLTTPVPPYADIILKILGFISLVNKNLFSDHKQYFSKSQLFELLEDNGWKPLKYHKFLFGLNSLIIAQKE